MKTVYTFLLIITASVLFSCNSYDIKKTTDDNYDVVEFPDGSTAYLNKNSSIEYNKDFEERTVNMEGEIFFVVTKGNSPFTVKSDEGEVIVLGTEFNLITLHNKMVAEVESGRIEMRIKNHIKKIEEGHKAFFNAHKEMFEISKAEHHHKEWLKKLDRDMKKLGKKIHKDMQKIDKKLKSDLKKLHNKMTN